MVTWQINAAQNVIVWRDEADALLVIIDAYDVIPIAWRLTGGWQFVLMPKPRVLVS